ncbi:putative hydrolase [Imtechella halotolerans K1]|uniref:Putative hydrolase n=2 Tax=Imtechella TaxID=1165076 RepID=I0WCA8_9FLAO|nr:putative hydrolase [Imtechella halotolerans K1]
MSKETEALVKERTKLRDSVKKLFFDKQDLMYFSLEHNDEALAYIDEFEFDNPQQYIADQLIATNTSKGDNPLVPYVGMEGTMKINKIKVLNHKWIICDFSDGSHWGELLLGYEINPDKSITFTLKDHLLYTRK